MSYLSLKQRVVFKLSITYFDSLTLYFWDKSELPKGQYIKLLTRNKDDKKSSSSIANLKFLWWIKKKKK